MALKRAVVLCPVEDSLLGLLGLLGQQHRLDVRQDASLSDGHSAQELVELLVVADCQLQVAGDDAGLLVVASRVSCQFQDLSGQILEYSSQVDGGTGTYTLSVVPLPQQPVHTANWKLQSSPRRAGLGLSPGLSAGLTSATHGFYYVTNKVSKRNTQRCSSSVLFILEKLAVSRCRTNQRRAPPPLRFRQTFFNQ